MGDWILTLMELQDKPMYRGEVVNIIMSQGLCIEGELAWLCSSLTATGGGVLWIILTPTPSLTTRTSLCSMLCAEGFILYAYFQQISTCLPHISTYFPMSSFPTFNEKKDSAKFIAAFFNPDKEFKKYIN